MAGDASTILTGTLDVLVLKALSWTPMHGFEITQWLEEQSRQELRVKDSALYQALYRLEERGLVKAEWGLTENNRRARYYHITPAGRAHLAAETDRWSRYAATVTGILTGPAAAARNA
jgi:transcriptional regulator